MKIPLCASTLSQALGWPLETQWGVRQGSPHETSDLARWFLVLGMHHNLWWKELSLAPPASPHLESLGRKMFSKFLWRCWCIANEENHSWGSILLFPSSHPPTELIWILPFLPFAPGTQHSVGFQIHSLLVLLLFYILVGIYIGFGRNLCCLVSLYYLDISVSGNKVSDRVACHWDVSSLLIMVLPVNLTVCLAESYCVSLELQLLGALLPTFRPYRNDRLSSVHIN